MISSHTVDSLFQPSGTHPEAEERVWAAAREFARTMTDVAPQGPGLESALRYAAVAAMACLHSIDTTV